MKPGQKRSYTSWVVRVGLGGLTSLESAPRSNPPLELGFGRNPVFTLDHPSLNPGWNLYRRPVGSGPFLWAILVDFWLTPLTRDLG